MAELNMHGATYGRDSAGSKTLLANMQKRIEDAISAVKGKDFTSLEKTVKMYWAGVDADKFLSEMDKQTTDMQEDFKKYSTLIEAAIEADAKSFASMQNTNADMIGK